MEGLETNHEADDVKKAKGPKKLMDFDEREEMPEEKLSHIAIKVMLKYEKKMRNAKNIAEAESLAVKAAGELMTELQFHTDILKAMPVGESVTFDEMLSSAELNVIYDFTVTRSASGFVVESFRSKSGS